MVSSFLVDSTDLSSPEKTSRPCLSGLNPRGALCGSLDFCRSRLSETSQYPTSAEELDVKEADVPIDFLTKMLQAFSVVVSLAQRLPTAFERGVIVALLLGRFIRTSE